MQNPHGGIRPPCIRKASGAVKEDAHVRWMYVVDNILWSLQLGDCKDDLKSVLVGEVQNTSAHMADSWGNFSDCSALSFSVLSNSQFVFSFQFPVFNFPL